MNNNDVPTVAKCESKNTGFSIPTSQPLKTFSEIIHELAGDDENCYEKIILTDMCSEDAFSICSIESDCPHLLEEPARIENNCVYLGEAVTPTFFIVDQKELINKFQYSGGDLNYSNAMSVLDMDDWQEVQQFADTLNSSVEVVLAICQLSHVENKVDVIATWKEPPCWRAEAIIKSLIPDENGAFLWGNEAI